jgi:hypothetical protein
VVLTRHRASSHRVPLTSAVLAVLLVLVGVGVASQDAMPGDVLWNVSKAVNSRRAESIEVAQQARQNLDAAAAALEAGHPTAAAAALEAARGEVDRVLPEHGHSALQARHRELAGVLPRTAASRSSRTPAPEPSQAEDTATQLPADARRGAAGPPSSAVQAVTEQQMPAAQPTPDRGGEEQKAQDTTARARDQAKTSEEQKAQDTTARARDQAKTSEEQKAQDTTAGARDQGKASEDQKVGEAERDRDEGKAG